MIVATSKILANNSFIQLKDKALIEKKTRGIGDFRRKWDDRDGIVDFHVAILRTVVLRVSPLPRQVEDEYRFE